MCVSSNSPKICTQANKSAYTPNYFFKLLNKKLKLILGTTNSAIIFQKWLPILIRATWKSFAISEMRSQSTTELTNMASANFV